MSKSVTASAPKNPVSLPTKSAWAKGPPLNTNPAPTRSQSPSSVNATQPNTPTHSRKPSALGGANAAFKDGVSVPRSIQPSQKPAPGLSFGSIAEPQAPLSSSPASVPPLSSDATNVKSFGSIPATNGVSSKPTTNLKPVPASKPDTHSNASSPPTPAKPKVDVKSFFRAGGTPAATTAPPDVSPTLSRAAPPNQPSTQPQQQQSQPQHAYYPRITTQPATAPNSNNTGAPRSPQYGRQMSNGAPSRPPNSAGLGPGSPRLGGVPVSHQLPPHAPPHPGMPPPMPQSWAPSYYYPYPPMHDPSNPYPQIYPWQAPALPSQMQHQPPPPPQQQQLPQQSHPSHGLPSPSRPPPPPLHANGAPPAHGPSSPYYAHPHPRSSPPPGTPQTPNPARLSTQAAPFVPNKRASSAIKIRNPNGEAVDLSAVASPVIGPSEGATPPQAHTPPTHQRKPTIIRMETEEARKKRMEEEQREKERRERDEQERTAKLYRDVEEKKRKRKEDEERKKQEEERKKQEEEQRKKREEERKKQEEEERKERERKKEEQRKVQERIRAEEERAKKEEEERKQREEEERKQREEEARERERKAKEEEEAAAAAAKAKADAEEQERLRKEAEEREKEKEKVSVLPTAATSTASTATSSPSPTPSLAAPKGSLPSDPPKPSKRPIPGPLDLSATSRSGVPPSLPSALATARAIESLDKIKYPEGYNSPKPELNAGASNGKFRYDRDFLLQFMAICKEKPDQLPSLDAIGLEPSDQGSMGRSRGNSRINAMAPPPVPGRSTSGGIGLGIMPFGSKVGPPTLSNFGSGKGTSEERFAATTTRSASVGGASGNVALPTRPTPMVRTASQGGSTPAQPSTLGPSGRTRSQRGGKRHDSNKVGGVAPATQERERVSSTFGSGSVGHGLGLEPVAPLIASENRWTPQSTIRRGQLMDPDSPEVVERKVKALLNKLTMERFDSISDQIIQWANRSETEKDGRTLIQVIRLVFEKATDEAAWSEMYARLCRKMMEQISQDVQDDGIRNTDGKPIAGGQLFRKYLLNRCQEDFERGWSVKEASARAAESKAADDKAAKDAADEAKASGKGTGEEVLYSDEYYAAQKAKRQGLGLVRFIGELFKLSMLTERIMHECIKKLLGNVENPEEEEIESLCKLLSTVGQQLDNAKARSHMDVYFQRMKELSKSSNITSRMQYMLLDVLELRDRKWVGRNVQAAPTTIAAVHEQAAKDQAKAQLEKEQAMRSIGRDPMSRTGSRRGEHRGGYGTQPGPDGWTPVASAPPRPPATAGDLTQFGKISKSAGGPMTFGPSSVFAKGAPKREVSLSRTNSTSNMFAMLNSDAAAEPPVAGKSSRPPSRKPSADFTQSGIPETQPQRKRITLLPRTIPVPGDTKVGEENAAPNSEEEGEASMTESQAEAKIKEDLKEFWAVRNLEEADAYFPALPVQWRALFVRKLVANALERKEADARLVAELLSRAAEKDACPPSSMEEGFDYHMEEFDDVSIDVPAAYKLMAILLKGSKLPRNKVEELAGKISVEDPVVLQPKFKLLTEYEKLDSS